MSHTCFSNPYDSLTPAERDECATWSDGVNAQTPDDDAVIYTYTSEQATSDGILFDIRTVNPRWKDGLFSHVTVNLMTHGYYNEDDTVNIPNLIDLLNQSLAIVRSKSENFTKHDWFFSGEIELPSGAQQQIFICQNETGKYTVMLPSDY